MSVSVPSMNSMRLSSPLSGPLSSLMGYESSLMVGAAAPAPSPRTSPHRASAWGCPPIQVKQEPAERDADSSGVSSMAHGSSFANTSPSSSSSAGSPPGGRGYPPMPPHHPGHLHDGGLSPRRASPASPAAPVHSTPVTSTPSLHCPVVRAPSPPRGPAAKVPRTPGSVDDNSRSSSCSNSEDDADEQVRRAAVGVPAQSQCPLCSFASDSSERLAEHVASHFKCSLCEFAAGSAEGLRGHLQDAHDLPVPDQQTPQLSPGPYDEAFMDQDHDDDLESMATPRVNSQGKVKTQRCKQCEFVAVTKLEFWQHVQQHIKPEKMLCCPKCPFVTEYKHHLEYHLRNHFNSKPFKCDKCSYSCVNKSMLNSHLKSHSNVYQYRCADCTYATKYCHSLKLHLRKYGHNPSVVLNPDGTPNPLPIIDVYGTRRGPKTKTSKAAQAAQAAQVALQQQQLQHQPLPQPQFPHGMFPPAYGLPAIFPYGPGVPPGQAGPPGAQDVVQAPGRGSPLLHRCSYCEFATSDAEALGQHVFVHAESMPGNLMQYFSANNNNYYQDGHAVKDFLGKTLSVRQSSPPAVPAATPALSPPRTPWSPSTARSAAAPSPANATNAAERPRMSAGGAPLDLSKPETALSAEAEVRDREPKNRRKGRAFKLERIAMRLQHHQASSGDEADRVDTEAVAVKAERLGADLAVPAPSPDHKAAPTKSPPPPSSPPTSPASAVGTAKEEYNCSYCDIAFRDIVMYTMHMGYHGYQDPFQCNMCGQQTTDKVAFFLHIARSSHS